MARPRATGVQQNTDGRYFVKVPAGGGKKVYLTKSKRQSTRWLVVLDGLENIEEARKRINLLKDAKDKADEDARIASILTTPKYLQLSLLDVRRTLNQLLNPQGISVTLPMASHWYRINHEIDYAESKLYESEGNKSPYDATLKLLKDWGAFQNREELLGYIGTNSDRYRCFKDVTTRIRRRKLNPEWMKEQPDFGIDELADHYRIPIDTVATIRTIEESQAAQYGVKPSKQKLSDCFDEWARIKSLQPAPPDAKHIGEIKKIFAAFVKQTRDKPVSHLTKDDFLAWKEHALREQKKGNHKATWFNKRLSNVRNVLRFLVKETSYPFPDPLPVWLEFSQQAYKPDKRNRERMPVDIFQRLLYRAETWADIEVEKYSKKLYLDSPHAAKPELIKANSKRTAQQTKRQGMLFSALLRLGCQCGYDNICICKLTQSNLRNLGTSLPYIELGRTKMERNSGEIIRLTPLLPATIKSIKRWIRFAGNGKTLFTSDKGNELRSDVITEAFKRLAQAVQVGGKPAPVEGWTMKHLRNIGSSVGRIHKRPDDERQAFLGHIANGSNKWYEDPDLGADYLLPLVNLIGKEYFEGEMVGET
jgi:hypothetical protein